MPILGVIASSAKGAPGIPTIGTATNVGTGRAFNNGAATVTFTPGAGATATSFTATSSPGGFTATGASSPLTVAGLQSSVSYTFTVTATNAAGTSAASAASNSITATTVPQAPTIGTATAGEGSATVAYTAGATGGATITTFTATSSPGSITGTGASPIAVSGLTNGTAYTFTVTATNANGTSAASAASNSVTPALIGAIQAWTTGGTVPNLNSNNLWQYFFAGAVRGGAGVTAFRMIASGGNAPPNGQNNTSHRSGTDNSFASFTASSYDNYANLTWGNGNSVAWANQFNGNAYLANRDSVTSFIMYNSFLNIQTMASMPWGRDQQNLTSTNIGVYAYGGLQSSNNSPTPENARYIDNFWTNRANMPAARSYLGMAGGNGFALAVGGGTTNSQSSDLANSNYIYNESLNSWSVGTNYPQSKSNMVGAYVNAGSTGVTANRYYMQGGFTTGFGQDSLSYSYTISSNAWRAERNTANGNRYANFGWTATTTNANNFLWICGGDNGSGIQRNMYYAQVI